jgi:hypothetical protein
MWKAKKKPELNVSTNFGLLVNNEKTEKTRNTSSKSKCSLAKNIT